MLDCENIAWKFRLSRGFPAKIFELLTSDTHKFFSFFALFQCKILPKDIGKQTNLDPDIFLSYFGSIWMVRTKSTIFFKDFFYDLFIFLLFLLAIFVPPPTSALPGVFRGLWSPIRDQKMPNYPKKCQIIPKIRHRLILGNWKPPLWWLLKKSGNTPQWITTNMAAMEFLGPGFNFSIKIKSFCGHLRSSLLYRMNLWKYLEEFCLLECSKSIYIIISLRLCYIGFF